MTTPKQLPLRLALPDEHSFANYLEKPGEHVIPALKLLFDAASTYKVLYLYGPSGVGKTHLLQAACHYSEQLGQKAFFLSCKQAHVQPHILEGLEHFSLVCFDDLEAICGCAQWEEALFHCYNKVIEAGGAVLVGATAPPLQAQISLADLRTRLGWGVVYKLKKLNDEQKVLVLQLRAKERGLMLSTQVGQYLLTHGPRDMSSLLQCLTTLDKASFVNKRRLTVPFVKSILGL